MSLCCECCVWSDRGLCNGLITHPGESYQLWCIYGGDYTRLLYTLLASEFSHQLVSEQEIN